MPSPTHSTGPAPVPDLDLSKLRTARPQTAEQSFLNEANQKIAAIVAAVGSKILTEMKADDYKAILAIVHQKDPSLTAEARATLLQQEATKRAAVEVSALPPLYADYTTALKAHGVAVASASSATGLDPVKVERILKTQIAQCIEAEVTAKMTEAYKEFSNRKSNDEHVKNVARVKYFSDAINNPKFDLNEWINKSGLKDPANSGEAQRFNEDLTKLRKSGVWHDPDPAAAAFSKYHIQENELKNHRAWMAGSWLVTVGGLVTLAYVAPVGLLFWAPVALTANYGIQKYHGWRHDAKFNAMFTEINRELKDAGPMEAGIAWAGVMHKFLSDYRPDWFLKDRTELMNGHDSKSIDAALRQLRQAASYGADSILRRDQTNSKETFFKDSKFNDYIKQNDDAMKAFEKRLKFFSDNAVKYSNPFSMFKKVMFG